MFLTSVQYFFSKYISTVLNKPIQVLELPKQTPVGSYVPLFENLRTASQRQHQVAKAEKSTECRTVFFPPDIPAKQLFICSGGSYQQRES